MKIPPTSLKSSSAIGAQTKRYRKPRSVLSSATLAAAAVAALNPNGPIQCAQVAAFTPPTSILGTRGGPKKTSRFFTKKAVAKVKEEAGINNTSMFLSRDEMPCSTDTQVAVKKEVKTKQEDGIGSEVIPRTQSFKPMWHGTLHPKTSIKVHSLIVGTHPSITSLEKSQYYGHAMNAFWWIAGDCLGFRRASGISPSSGKPYKLVDHLVHAEDKVISYEEQLEVMASNGFAMWDLLGSCERKGSLDNDIKEEQPNPLREFCQDHPTINRIIMANGAKQCTFFNKYFAEWWLSGELKPGNNELSRKAFEKKWSKKTDGFKNGRIEVYCMPGVSPAAASISYEVKRDVYREFCYNPGLSDHKKVNLKKL